MNKNLSIGLAIHSVLREKNISIADAAKMTGFSERDFRRVVEGKLLLSPTRLRSLATSLSVSFDYLMNFSPEKKQLLPDLEYNKSFTNDENLFKIVELIDEYIELKEQM